MKSGYLWDRSGEPDPEIQRLENLLGALRYREKAFSADGVTDRRRGWLQLPAFLSRPLFAAAVVTILVLFAVAGWWQFAPRQAYEVISLGGSPTVGSTRMTEAGRLRVGQWLETDAKSRARILVGDIGQVEIEPNTRIRLDKAQSTEHRMSLRRGAIHAIIWAPPKLFYVNTPSAQAIDMGCAYTLEVAEDGSGVLKVTIGWVAFENNGRESFVPGGAECRTWYGAGPGTPYMTDATAPLRSALAKLDSGGIADDSRSGALAVILSEARRADAFTLWHLMARVRTAERGVVFDRLARLVPPPATVSRQGVLSLDRRMMDLWWDELGLGNTGWWRLWKGSFPENK